MTKWIIKIGGSLLGSSELSLWLDLIATHSDGNMIIVPGGALFADAVREAQTIQGFSDACAHRLAVRAMDQFADVMVDMQPKLVKADSELELAERGWQHRAIVWSPSHMVLSDAEIPKNWTVSSDSLALWLARKTNADHVLFVKSCQVLQGGVSALVRHHVLDAAFSSFMQDSAASCWIVDKYQHKSFQEGFTDSALIKTGVKLTLDHA